MKRSDIKIGKMIEFRSENKVARGKIEKFIAVLLILGFTSCQKAWHGHDGQPGDAFISLTWQVEEPSFIDIGTGAVPPVFYWGESYEIRPGNYSLYYEGQVWTGSSWANYSWEVMYEIWEEAGERGDWYYNGSDGPDNYFNIDCSPYGPYVSNGYKSSNLISGYNLISESEDEITVEQKADGMKMKITYRKSEKGIKVEVKK
ncbi:MAG: hypothetical protein DRJ05_07790 [Bacteroidetes bacterium]|nr:MAG: hypothetical protein DRJ05_07790 [Bacteroidota bacterium]